MSKTVDVYIIREHENAALTRTIPEQTRLNLFTWPRVHSSSMLRRRLEQDPILTTVSSDRLQRKREERNGIVWWLFRWFKIRVVRRELTDSRYKESSSSVHFLLHSLYAFLHTRCSSDFYWLVGRIFLKERPNEMHIGYDNTYSEYFCYRWRST